MTKSEIIAKFENRFNVEGYREACRELGTLKGSAFGKRADEIAEQFGQGINTVCEDAFRA